MNQGMELEEADGITGYFPLYRLTSNPQDLKTYEAFS
jgi:hypothetical protein